MSLPSGYKRLEYIQSSGTQWIDTGFKPNQNTRIKMDCNVISFNSGDAFLFGARIASGNTAFCLAADDANTRWFALYGNAVQNPTGTCTGKHSIDFNQNVLTLDGKNFTFEKTTFQSSYNLLLFAAITNGNVDSQRGKMAIYSCQIYDNGTLIRDYIPCKTTSGEIGMWDDVNSVFYGNAGTGNFTAGAEVKGSHKTMIDGTWYDLKAGKCLVGGTAYSVKNGRVLVNSTGYNIPFSKGITLNTITPGAILYLNESGSPVPFYIAKHDYESGLNGAGRTLVVRKDCYDMRSFASPEADFPPNNYATSRLDSWLRGTYTNFLDIDTRALIGTTKFYYTPGYGGRVTTLQRTVFQLSFTELGKSASGEKPEGSVLPIASKLQIAYRNGSKVYQWTRSPVTMLSDTVYCLDVRGTLRGDAVNRSYGSRPAFTLPGTLGLVQNPDGTYIIAE